MNSGVYVITNTINGKRYVGQTNNWNRRQRQYRYDAKTRPIQVIHHAINKYGIDNFTFELVYTAPDDAELLDRLERRAMSEYNPEYNIRSGGQNGYRHSEETRMKISESNKGKGRPSMGYHIWDESGTKHLVEDLGAFCAEHDLDIRAMARVVTCWVDSHKGYRGEHVDDELRELYQHNRDKRSMKTGTSLRHKTISLKSPDGCKVIIENIAEFCREHELNKGAISLVAKGKRKSHKGWTLFS